jgi:hypothetical protein
MSNGAGYYALSLTVEGASTPAYYSMNPDSNLEISQGGASFAPTAMATTIVSIYPQEMSIQAPPGLISAGATIITDADVIAGRVLVSPPVDVSVVLTVYGAGSTQLGQVIIDPGETGKTFSFPTDSGKSMSSADAIDALKQRIATA